MLVDDRLYAARGKPDAAGIVLFALAAATGLVWLSSAGHHFAWGSATSVALLASALALDVALVRVERPAERPFLPIELLALPAVRYAVLTVLAFASAMFAMVFSLPVYLQFALHSIPAESGLLLLPLTGGIVAGAALTGRIIVWTGRRTAIPSVGVGVAAIALVGLALLPPIPPILVGLGIMTGLGLGSVMSVMQIVTQTAAGRARLGAAASTLSLARTLGVAWRFRVRRADLRPDGRRAGDRRHAQRRSRRAHRPCLRDRLPRRGGAVRGCGLGSEPGAHAALRCRAPGHGAGRRLSGTGCSPGITILGA